MAEKSQNLVGPQIRRLRRAAGMSQNDLAIKLQVKGWDISRGGVSKIESRLRLVNDAEIFLLAAVLGHEIKELFPNRPARIKDVLRQGRD
ncbi:helix-turn-helix transcriptional regulator [Luteolibacter yonseiensis]|uniref:Helix-turn-helix transcriptional regulator n=1 Tax=Luteolibacter yonseiensis TaxID=1144680 RepID=A0A934R2X7_9BACT|nr:helix-turn-helix transcriptional regulator [Luteolibacter yonseiensis]MBK1817413.1 helix-turn-helix transcriptional regulator [Luteolibacter yonseiensis]